MTLTPEEVQTLKEDILRSLHCALPGQVESFDAERGVADVRPMIRLIDGIEMPVLQDVPVFLPLPEMMTVNEGDVCLVVFADRGIDRWMESGEESDGITGRFHDLSDGFAFVGFGAPGKLSGGQFSAENGRQPRNFPACQGGTL